MDYIGLDLGKTSSQICILTADGELLERRIKTERSSFTKLLGERSPARILLEASTESEWVARFLEEMGHEVIVADPNFAPMYATRTKRVKTDRRDALALCDACRLGAYRQAHRTSDQRRQTKNLLTVREALVRTRAKYILIIKTLVRAEGLRITSKYAPSFIAKLEETPLPESLLVAVRPLLDIMRSLNEQINNADTQLKELAHANPVVERLCTVPGVGVVTAMSFIAAVDQASRFETAKQVRGYLGLVPSEHSSGEKQRRGARDLDRQSSHQVSVGGGGLVNAALQTTADSKTPVMGSRNRTPSR